MFNGNTGDTLDEDVKLQVGHAVSTVTDLADADILSSFAIWHYVEPTAAGSAAGSAARLAAGSAAAAAAAAVMLLQNLLHRLLRPHCHCGCYC